MIVEDEAVVALHLRQELTKLGHTVAGMAATGEQALKLIEEVFPDIVLMDIHIQGEMDGIETAKRIPRYLHIPVVFLTAYSEDTTLKRAADTYPYGYLIKPFWTGNCTRPSRWLWNAAAPTRPSGRTSHCSFARYVLRP